MGKVVIDNEPAYILHAYPYRETSLILEVFSRENGRLGLVARGARRPRSVLRGVLLAFVPLELSWFGTGELRTLARAEWVGGQPLLAGRALMCAYYLNELMLKLCARDDPHPGLYDLYADTLRKLAQGVPIEPLLRRFEVGLLRELGYGLRVDVDARIDGPIEAGESYAYIIERGAVSGAAEAGAPRLMGQELIDIAASHFDDPKTLAAAKTLMRHLINHHLGGAPLQSRRVFRELQEL